MRCPACNLTVYYGASECPHCSFEAMRSQAEREGQGLSFSKIHDEAGIFRRRDQKKVQRAVEAFERRFPQAFFAFHAAQYDQPIELRSRAFWLLNNAEFVDVPSDRERDCGVICVVDVTNRQLTLAVGYSLMPYLTDEQCFSVMGAAHGLLLESNWAAVLRRIVEKLSTQLRKGAGVIKKRPLSLLDPVRQQLVSAESEAMSDWKPTTQAEGVMPS